MTLHSTSKKVDARDSVGRQATALRLTCEGSQLGVKTMYILGERDVISGTRQSRSFEGVCPQIGEICGGVPANWWKFAGGYPQIRGNLRGGTRKLGKFVEVTYILGEILRGGYPQMCAKIAGGCPQIPAS